MITKETLDQVLRKIGVKKPIKPVSTFELAKTCDFHDKERATFISQLGIEGNIELIKEYLDGRHAYFFPYINDGSAWAENNCSENCSYGRGQMQRAAEKITGDIDFIKDISTVLIMWEFDAIRRLAMMGDGCSCGKLIDNLLAGRTVAGYVGTKGIAVHAAGIPMNSLPTKEPKTWHWFWNPALDTTFMSRDKYHAAGFVDETSKFNVVLYKIRT